MAAIAYQKALGYRQYDRWILAPRIMIQIRSEFYLFYQPPNEVGPSDPNLRISPNDTPDTGKLDAPPLREEWMGYRPLGNQNARAPILKFALSVGRYAYPIRNHHRQINAPS